MAYASCVEKCWDRYKLWRESKVKELRRSLVFYCCEEIPSSWQLLKRKAFCWGLVTVSKVYYIISMAGSTGTCTKIMVLGKELRVLHLHLQAAGREKKLLGLAWVFQAPPPKKNAMKHFCQQSHTYSYEATPPKPS